MADEGSNPPSGGPAEKASRRFVTGSRGLDIALALICFALAAFAAWMAFVEQRYFIPGARTGGGVGDTALGPAFAILWIALFAGFGVLVLRRLRAPPSGTEAPEPDAEALTRREERRRRATPASKRGAGRALVLGIILTGAGAGAILGLMPEPDASSPIGWVLLAAGILILVVYAKTR